MFIPEDIDRIIEMAWEDRTPFEAIEAQFGINQQGVIAIMRSNLKLSSFQLWRKRTHGQTTKHLLKRGAKEMGFKCALQRTISHNKISKRGV